MLHNNFVGGQSVCFALAYGALCGALAACSGNIEAKSSGGGGVRTTTNAAAGWCATFDIDNDGCISQDEFDFQQGRFEERCENGTQHWCDQLDGLVDCFDYESECTPVSECAIDFEHSDDWNSCKDECDNDGDGATDCEEADCARAPNCVEHSDKPASCNDGDDNDLDGLVDCDEADCDSASNCRDDSGEDDGETPADLPFECHYYRDADGDGFGDGGVSQPCSDSDHEAPEGWTQRYGDCNDADENVNPWATEVCDGVDNDCQGGADSIPYCLCKVSDDVCKVNVHSYSPGRGGPNQLRVLWVTGTERDANSQCYSRKPYAIINEWYYDTAGRLVHDDRFRTCDEIPLCADVTNLGCH